MSPRERVTLRNLPLAQPTQVAATVAAGDESHANSPIAVPEISDVPFVFHDAVPQLALVHPEFPFPDRPTPETSGRAEQGQ